MIIETKPYGKMEVDEKQMVRFPGGLYGFEHLKKYCLLETKEEGPFYWLQSLDDSEIAFVLIDPREFRPDYVPSVAEADWKELGIGGTKDALVFAIVTIPSDPARMTANLTGPLAINTKDRVGAQVISSHADHRVKHYILDEMRELSEAEEKTASC